MHIVYKKIKLIIVMLICILLLSNYGINTSFVYASNTVDTPFLTYTSNFQGNYKTENGNLIVSFAEGGEVNVRSEIIIKPKETGIYSLTVTGTDENNENRHFKYSLYNNTSKPWHDIRGDRVVRLAAVYGNNQYTVITDNRNTKMTTIDIVLIENQEYKLVVNQKSISGITVTAQKRNIGKEAIAFTNLHSSQISTGTWFESKVNGNGTYDDPYPLEAVPAGYRTIDYSDKEREIYYNQGLDALNSENNSVENGGPLEGILVDLVMGLCSTFMRIVESSLGANVRLTIENVIFNRLDQTVIDLTPLGGIDLTVNNEAAGRGIFNNEVITNIVSTLFNSLKSLSIMIYIVMLLVIGIKILLSVGTKDQSKYLKYIEYWITGIIILVVVPYFLPAIPVISNSIVELMSTEANSINSNYSTEEVLKRLGYDESLLGEDAEIVQYEQLINERIVELDALIADTPGTREEAQANIDANIQEALNKFHDLTDEQKSELEEKINAVKNIIDKNFDTWNNEVQDNYENAISDVKEYILENSSKKELVNQVLDGLSDRIKNDAVVYKAVENIIIIVQRDPELKYTSSLYAGMCGRLSQTMLNRGLSEEISTCMMAIEQVRDEYLDYTSSEAFSNLNELFEDYKNAVIQEEIEVLEDMRDNLKKDIMFTLKSKAQKENRFIYAIAWVILLYQTFAVLFMYYKRVIAVVILIVIFPIVMAFYVFDKMGDGQSQSLSTWIKEFLATMLVQILHAAVYIILINIGIDACATDPTRYWFFLMLAVCFLFPGERILRGIIGLGGSSTLGELKNNFGGLMMGGYAVIKMARSGYRTVKNIKNSDAFDLEKKHQEKIKAKEKEEAAKQKKKTDLERSKERNRQYRNMLKDDMKQKKQNRINASDERIRRHEPLSAYDKARVMKANVKNKISNLENNPNSKSGRVIKGVKTYGKAGIDKAAKYGKATINGVKTAGKAGLKGAKFVGKISSKGYNFTKKAFNVGKKAVGVTMGALEGMENFSHGGAMSALGTASSVARNYGVMSKEPKLNISSKKQSSSTAARFKSKYSNGTRVSNNVQGQLGVGADVNISGGASNSSTTTNAGYARIRTNYNYSNPTIIDNAPDNSGNAGGAGNNGNSGNT